VSEAQAFVTPAPSQGIFFAPAGDLPVAQTMYNSQVGFLRGEDRPSVADNIPAAPAAAGLSPTPDVIPSAIPAIATIADGLPMMFPVTGQADVLPTADAIHPGNPLPVPGLAPAVPVGAVDGPILPTAFSVPIISRPQAGRSDKNLRNLPALDPQDQASTRIESDAAPEVPQRIVSTKADTVPALPANLASIKNDIGAWQSGYTTDGIKKILTTDKEANKVSVTSVGTNVAKSTTLMPETAEKPISMEAGNTQGVPPVPANASETFVRELAQSLPAETSHSAQRAVETVLATVEQFAAGDRHAVNLQFNVSGVDLAVQVVLRGDAVHTTFRTDSPELRAALAHEWQSATNQSGDHAQRLADPVFTASPSGSASTLQANSGGSQQRETAAQNQEPRPFNLPRIPAPPPAASASPAGGNRPMDTDRLLHAFA
jgi:hypothetical protein